jgi:cbb3-type cytochrome oxidase subunit 3
MEITQENGGENSAPKPKIDATDAFTVVPRLLAGFFLGGLSIMYAVAQNWAMVAFLGVSSAILLYWAFRLINKMRSENADYIAHRAAEEAAARAMRKANRAR